MDTDAFLNATASADPLMAALLEIYGNAQKGWYMKRSYDPARMWIEFTRQDAQCPQQGWKLHVSADPSSAETILRCIVPLLFNHSAPFKVISSLSELANLNRGIYGLSQIGKFLTLYPAHDQQAVAMAQLLDTATGSLALAGPKIPSDRALFPGSLVHYRYGEFRGNLFIQSPNGAIEPAIRTPENELIPDRRRQHYSAPAWVVDPFLAAGIAVEPPQTRRLLNQRYVLVKAIASSPTHIISLAADLQAARSCIVKGPGFAWEERANNLLRQEARTLTQMAPDPSIPQLYDVVEQDQAVFLVMEDIQGENLTRYIARSAEMGKYLPMPQVLSWARQLCEILGRIHHKGLVYADVKSSNVLVDTDDTLHLVDFELSGEQGQSVLAGWGGGIGTPGYMAPQRHQCLPLTIADDIYSFGALLYFLVTSAEPSELPRPHALLERPPEWFRPEGLLMKPIIARCLQQQPEARYSSMTEVMHALDAVNAALENMDNSPSVEDEVLAYQLLDPTVIARSAVLEVDIPGSLPPLADTGGETQEYAEQQRLYATLSRRLLETLCKVAQHPVGREECFWRSAHQLAYGMALRDINTGNAGTLLALAELVAAYPEAEKQTILAAGARWLRNSQPLNRERPLPGLYVGEAGVGAALLRAGQVLRDEKLLLAACEQGRRVASLPYSSPDLFNGTAGRLRFHLWLWDETGEKEHMHAALACGKHLRTTGQREADQTIYWPVSEGFGSMSGQKLLGYAHGVAGIADALLDLSLASGDDEYVPEIQSAAHTLQSQVILSHDGQWAANWPRYPGGPQVPAFWCHGSTGIGLFLLHAANYGILSEAEMLATHAARAVVQGTRWAGPTFCHGLTGNIEFLLEMYQETGERTYLKDAFLLAEGLTAFAAERDGLLVFCSESPTTFTPDYMVGYAGVSLCLLRLSMAGEGPHQLSRRGFRYNHRQTSISQ